MIERSAINPVENIRLSSELWKNSAEKKIHFFQQKAMDIYDRCLIAQVNFTDRMKENAALASAQSPQLAFANTTALGTGQNFTAPSFTNSLTAISKQISLLAEWSITKAKTVIKALTLITRNSSAKLAPVAAEQIQAVKSLTARNLKQPTANIMHHPVKILTIVLFTGLTIYVVMTATQAFVNSNW